MDEYNIFKEVVLKSSEGKQRNKEDLIELVKLSYNLVGKGKIRSAKRDPYLKYLKLLKIKMLILIN